MTARIAYICSIEGCGRKHHSKGFCQQHYKRSRGAQDKPIDAPIRKYVEGGEDWTAWMTNKKGYIFRQRRVDGKIQQQLQHRVVMEEMLGRPLLPSETAHHKNLIRSDNRPENLELWVSSQPAGARVEDLLEWADQIIALYRT